MSPKTCQCPLFSDAIPPACFKSSQQASFVIGCDERAFSDNIPHFVYENLNSIKLRLKNS